MGRTLRKYLIAGLLVWLPLGVTFLTFRFLLELLDRLLLLFPPRLQPEALVGFHVPGFGVLLAFGVVLLTGMLVANFIGRRLLGWWELVLERIPLVRSIYSGVKGLTETIFTDTGQSFSRVVLVEYPRKEMWSIGFVTATDLPAVDAVTGGRQVCVYVPTTPNPTSGLIVFVPAAEVVEVDMSVDDAMKMVVTLGVVGPPKRATPEDANAG
ncbi:MAG: hypothetical protein RL026_552 [Pseudomonadota bacterium]